MKHLGLVQIILILGAGAVLWGTAGANAGLMNTGLTAYQSFMPSAEVGQMVNVIVSLTYNGQNATQARVTPNLPPGLVANVGEQSLDLYPGKAQQVSYPLTVQQSGSYLIVSEISYIEVGAWRSLRLEDPFTAIESQTPPIQPDGEGQPSGPFPGPGSNINPTGPYSPPPEGAMPGEDHPQEEDGINHTGEPPVGPQGEGFGGPPGPMGY